MYSHSLVLATFAIAYPSFVGSSSPLEIISSDKGLMASLGYMHELPRFISFLIFNSLAEVIIFIPICILATKNLTGLDIFACMPPTIPAQ